MENGIRETKQGCIHGSPCRGRLGRGSIELGRGSNDLGRGSKGRSHTKSKSVTDRPTDRHSCVARDKKISWSERLGKTEVRMKREKEKKIIINQHLDIKEIDGECRVR